VTALVTCAAIALLGAAGALARFGLDALVATRWRGELPAGTLVVNLSGSLALGVLVGLAPATDAMRLAGTALLGSYTTFSTWMFETERATEAGETGVAAANVLLSLVLGVACAALGRAIGEAL
jgi:CrcB protein